MQHKEKQCLEKKIEIGEKESAGRLGKRRKDFTLGHQGWFSGEGQL